MTQPLESRIAAFLAIDPRTFVDTQPPAQVVYLLHDAQRLVREMGELRKGQEWQPIETAPRDGSVVLLWNAYAECFIGTWIEPLGCWVNWFMRCSGDHYPVPSHWMPLPAAPQQRPAVAEREVE